LPCNGHIALEEGSSITDIAFDEACTFLEGGKALIANALLQMHHQSSMSNLQIAMVSLQHFGRVPPCNSTLQNLQLGLPEDEYWWKIAVNNVSLLGNEYGTCYLLPSAHSTS
jgi:hypothetical protein